MLDVKAAAMDPLAAAATIFEQAADGRFYLLTAGSRLGRRWPNERISLHRNGAQVESVSQ